MRENLAEISYDEMLEIANLGAGVLHPRAVEFAKNHNLPLRVRPAAYGRGRNSHQGGNRVGKQSYRPWSGF